MKKCVDYLHIYLIFDTIFTEGRKRASSQIKEIYYVRCKDN